MHKSTRTRTLRRFKKASPSIIKFLVELCIVAIGVFLGIFVSGWKTEKNDHVELTKSLDFIILELEENSVRLERSIDYHQELRSSINELGNKVSEENFLQPYFLNKSFRHTTLPGWDGMGIAEVQSIAFESTKLSGTIRNMDIETIQVISRVYQQQEFYKQLSNNVLSRLLEMNSQTTVIDVIGILEVLTSDVLASQINLKKQIDRTVDFLKSNSQ